MVVNNIKENVEQLEHKNAFTVTKTIFETIQKYGVVIKSLEDSLFAKNITDYITTNLQTNVPNDYIMKTSKYLPIFYFSAVASVIVTWLKEGTKETPEEMAKLIASLMDGV